MNKLVKRYYSTVIMLLFLLVIWEVGTRFFDVPSYILPPPSHILHSFFTQFPLLITHTVTTLAEVALGIALGVTGGIGLAIAIFYSPTIERTTYPLIIASQMIPVFAIAPLLVLWFGYGIWPKAIVAGLIVFFPIVVNTVDGFVRGLAEGIAYTKDHPEEALRIFFGEHSDINNKLHQLAFEATLPLFADNASHDSYQKWNNLQEYLVNNGLMTDPLIPEQLFTTEFLPSD